MAEDLSLRDTNDITHNEWLQSEIYEQRCEERANQDYS